MNLKRLRRVLRRLWFFHFHINIKYRLNLKMEEKGIVAHDCCPGLSPAGAPLPWATGSVQQAAGLRRETTPGNGQRSAGSGAPADNPGQQSQTTIPFSSMSPQFLLNHGRDNPHYESRCGNTRDLREPDAV